MKDMHMTHRLSLLYNKYSRLLTVVITFFSHPALQKMQFTWKVMNIAKNTCWRTLVSYGKVSVAMCLHHLGHLTRYRLTKVDYRLTRYPFYHSTYSTFPNAYSADIVPKM